MVIFMDKERVTESLKQAGLLLVFLCGGGLLSNLPMMIPGIFGVFISKENTGNQTVSYIQWGIMAVIGAATCVLVALMLSKSIGDNAALYAIHHKLDRKMDTRYMLITVGGALAAYLLVSIILGYQYVDGPVPYIMRILGRAERKINESEIENIPYIIKFVSMLIHLAIVAPFPFIGYKKGYRERIAFQEEEEAEKGINENS